MIEIIFIGLSFAVFALLTLILPILSFVRAQAANRVARELAGRVESLERAVSRLAAARREEARPREEAQRPIGQREPGAPAPDVVRPASPAVSRPVQVPVPAPASSTAPPSRLGPVVVDPPQPQEERAPFDLEQLIGGRWLLYAGVAAVVLGVSYFVKFAFDNGWISEPMRVAGGVATGLALVGAGIRFTSRGLAPFGQALSGGGIVVLYVSIYAALHFYKLIAAGPAFGLMAAVTAGAAWLAHQQRAQPIAMLALLGGFATPFLVGGERDVQVVLFTYVAILISGTAVLAHRHGWPLLSAAAYICTFSLVVMWSFASYES